MFLPCQEVEKSLSWSCTMNLSESLWTFWVYPNKGLRTLIWKNYESKRNKAREQFSFDFHSVSHYTQFCGYIHVQFFSWFVVYPLYITEAHEYDSSFLHSHVGSVSRPKKNSDCSQSFPWSKCLSFFHCFCSGRLLIASHDIQRVQSIGKTNDFNHSSVFQRSTTSTTEHTLQCRDAQQCNGSRSNWTICEFSSQCRRSRSWTWLLGINHVNRVVLGDPGREELDSPDVRLDQTNLWDRINLEDLEDLHRGHVVLHVFMRQVFGPTKIGSIASPGNGQIAPLPPPPFPPPPRCRGTDPDLLQLFLTTCHGHH